MKLMIVKYTSMFYVFPLSSINSHEEVLGILHINDIIVEIKTAPMESFCLSRFGVGYFTRIDHFYEYIT